MVNAMKKRVKFFPRHFRKKKKPHSREKKYENPSVFTREYEGKKKQKHKKHAYKYTKSS